VKVLQKLAHTWAFVLLARNPDNYP